MYSVNEITLTLTLVLFYSKHQMYVTSIPLQFQQNIDGNVTDI